MQKILILTCLFLVGCDSPQHPVTTQLQPPPQEQAQSQPVPQPQGHSMLDTMAHAAVAGAAAGAAGTVAAKATDHVINKYERRARYRRIMKAKGRR